ncbi:galactosylgalactosylxylosylprotein 3-beta-glucuronosyltransferase I-like [Ornithodoros turicata]|uniref:galactosylgalactosylxylosylprotein 3-beta-glucuronosyltransferase I-like n=1 Tax=Ornithodoros turicata TaxID=34597 RepID=UPI003139573C
MSLFMCRTRQRKFLAKIGLSACGILTLIWVTKYYLAGHYPQESWVNRQRWNGCLRTVVNRARKQDPGCAEDIWRNLGADDLPVIYVITPTYARPVQKAELTRLSYTFALVPNLHWIVVEDASQSSTLVKGVLERSGMPYTLLNTLTPPDIKPRPNDPSWVRPRGVAQRNAALRWLRSHAETLDPRAVVYFADDDNTYDVRLFEEMRFTRRVSVWPVGLVGGLYVERPVLGSNGSVVGWNSVWRPQRPYPIDMAGFAVSLRLLLHQIEAEFTVQVSRGYQESHLIGQLVSGLSELEPKAQNEVLVWHTRTEKPKLKQEAKLKVPSNFGIEV